jgi:hypothetical protein
VTRRNFKVVFGDPRLRWLSMVLVASVVVALVNCGDGSPPPSVGSATARLDAVDGGTPPIAPPVMPRETPELDSCEANLGTPAAATACASQPELLEAVGRHGTFVARLESERARCLAAPVDQARSCYDQLEIRLLREVYGADRYPLPASP